MRRHKAAKPMRRCIACRESRPQDELIRFTFDGSAVSADRGVKSEGRGFYLCKSTECLETAIKRRAFNRVCRRDLDTEEIRKVVEQALDDHQGGIDVKKG